MEGEEARGGPEEGGGGGGWRRGEDGGSLCSSLWALSVPLRDPIPPALRAISAPHSETTRCRKGGPSLI